jgi:probable DNA repair protein
VRLAYAREAQLRGLQAWPTPRVLPWSAWLRQQRLEARAGGAQGLDRSRVLTAAQARVIWDDVVAGSRAARDLLNPSSAARLAARSWRRLHDYLVGVESLLESDAPEARALHGWCVEFRRRCDALDAIDESSLAHWAYEVSFEPRERVSLAGFDTLTPAMARLIGRWRERGLVVDAESSPRAPAQIELIAADDAAAELVLAARWASERLGAGVGQIGVILPDLSARREEVRRAFEDVFAPGSRHVLSAAMTLPVVIAAPASMAGYPLVDAALLILQLAAGECSSTHAGRVLRSPFIAGGDSERARRSLADVRLRKEQRDRWNWFELERWAGVTGCAQLEASARSVAALLRENPRTAPASEWVERFQAVLLASGWPGERTLNSVEHQTLEKFQGVLAELGTLDAVTPRMSLLQALGRLRDLLNDTPFEPQTIAAAVTVIDAATSAGMQFDALWVAGLDVDHLPAPVNPDPLIPLDLQRSAGVPEASAAGVLQLATQQLQRWMTSAASLVLSWPQRDGDVHLGRSPLLDPIDAMSRIAPTPPTTDSLRYRTFVERPTLEAVQDDRAPSLPPQAARGGARTIELQSRCAFRAQAEIRLHADLLPRVSMGVEPVDRGAILHRVLAEVWGTLRTQERLLSANVAQLEEQVRECAQRHAAQALRADTRHRSRLAALEVGSVVRQVLQLLEIEKQRPAFAVRLAEAAEQFAIGGLSITLRPDRIDEVAEGELLIDYKLGSAHKPRDWFDVRPGRPRRPQLPLYGLARAERLRALAYVVLAPGTIEFRGWSDGTEVGAGVAPYPTGMRIDLGDPPDWEGLLHHWRFTLTRLAERYVAGDASVDPLPLECAMCHLSTLCRVHERIAGAQDDQGAADD